MISLFLPSPSISSFSIGPLTVHFYALCILSGIIVAALLGRRRLMAKGAADDQFDTMLLIAVIAGIIGARLYHVITDHELYFSAGQNPWDALKMWNGGLGIWGGVVFGALVCLVWCRRAGIKFGAVADGLAPGLILAQGIGRLGNWFNQELFGKPTTLPWGLMIDPVHRPTGFEQYATFHPTFLYELIWDIGGAILLLWLDRHFPMGRGKLFTSYIAYYCFGRFFIEALRIDPANHYDGFRLNNYTAAIGFMISAVFLVWQFFYRRGRDTTIWRDDAKEKQENIVK